MDTIWFPDLSADGDARSKHQAIGRSIREAISDGSLSPGDRLPPVREVGWRLGVTPGTVARAYKDLVDQDVLTAVVGRGTFVAAADPAPPPGPLPYLMEPQNRALLNLRTAQVADVGQGAVFHDLLRNMPPPHPDAYVSYPMAEDEAPLRAALADWFSGADHGEIAPEDVVPTSGGQHALVTIMLALLHGPRPVVLTEDLSYTGVRHAAGLVRAEIAGVGFDDEGLLPEALDRAAAETGAQLLVTSAGAHNPTTIRTSPARRREIAAIARRRGLQIVDDDCFGLEVASANEASYRLLAPERSWVVSSLSKTLSPDLRVGAIIGPPGRVQPARIAAQQQFFGLSRPLVDLVTRTMTTGAAHDIAAKVRAAAQARVELTREVMGRHGIVLRDNVPFGWLRMPRGWRASSYMRAAETRGIRLKAADEFALVDGRAPNAVRVALTAVRGEAEFRGALDRLSDLLDAPSQQVEA